MRQTAFDKLSRGVKEALPVCRRQVRPLRLCACVRFTRRAPADAAWCAPLTRIMRALQILIRQQVEKTRLAFIEYQRAHDAHAEAKAAAAAVENQLMASSGALGGTALIQIHPCSPLQRAGGSVVDTDLLSQSSDLASRVIETESHKLKADRVHAAEARCALCYLT